MTVKFENLVYMQSNCGVVKRFGRIHTSVQQKNFLLQRNKENPNEASNPSSSEVAIEKQSFNLSAKLWH